MTSPASDVESGCTDTGYEANIRDHDTKTATFRAGFRGVVRKTKVRRMSIDLAPESAVRSGDTVGDVQCCC